MIGTSEWLIAAAALTLLTSATLMAWNTAQGRTSLRYVGVLYALTFLLLAVAYLVYGREISQ